MKILDVGCGSCSYIDAMRGLGHAAYGVDLVVLKETEFVKRIDVLSDAFERFVDEYGPFDIVVCLEVGQQIAPSRATHFVKKLCLAADVIIFSSAQTGSHANFNNRPKDYWKNLFADNHFIFNEEKTTAFAEHMRLGYHFGWLPQNMMVLYKHTSTDWSLEQFERQRSETMPQAARFCQYLLSNAADLMRPLEQPKQNPPRAEFIHLEKNAGTSIRKVLKDYIHDRPHRTASELREHLSPSYYDKVFKFAFVRNPWDRMVSMYNFVRLLLNPQDPWCRHICNALKCQQREIKFRDFVLEWDGYFVFDRGGYHHVLDIRASQIAQLCDVSNTNEQPLLLVDFIGRFENLASDYHELCTKHLGFKAEDVPPLPCLNVSSKREGGKCYTTYYDDELKQAVATWYKADIEKFGYTFE